MILNRSNREVEVRSAPIREVRVATADNGTHSVSGYAIVYNSQSVDLGGFTEIVAPGSLTRTLTDNPDVLCLRDHKQTLLLGRTTSGTLKLTEDQTGLYFTCSLPATSAGNDLAESLRRGDIDSCSFGFCVANDIWSQDTNGAIVRTLLDVDLFEISVVSFPAYASTSASLRSAPVEIRSAIEASLKPITLPAVPVIDEQIAANHALAYQRSKLALRLLELSAQ
jgi:HK97 family phage prohead protease